MDGGSGRKTDSGIKRLGRYNIVREIGRGAMGVVYLAEDPVIGRSVALKTAIFPADLEPSQRRTTFERFMREAKAAGGLSHPGIVTVYDAGIDEHSSLCYIAMEYVPGGTLKEEMAGAGPLSEERVLALARRVAEALGHAHEHGIVHRDLKPANILLGDDGSIKIADFGIARMETSDLTRDGETLGSPAYMSPEQIQGRRADQRSDLFSLGVMLYQMLTGRRPFDGEFPGAVTYQIVHEEPTPLREHRPGISAGWERLMTRLVAKRPVNRYPDVRGLLKDLDSVQRGEAPVIHPAGQGDIDRTVDDLSSHRDGGGAGIPSPHRILTSLLSRLPMNRRVFNIGVAVLAIVLMFGSLDLLLGSSARVSVNLKHGLAGGHLLIEVDGGTVVDRRFEGEQRSTRVFGKDLFERSGGELTAGFSVPPGEHEIRVTVNSEEEGESWSRTVHKSFDRNGRNLLEVRVATAFARGLKLKLKTVE